MLRVGTVFSGIGAIEHALLRMGINEKIVFACDNGDVDIFKQNIPTDMNVIDREIKILKQLINNHKTEIDGDEEFYAELKEAVDKIQKRYENIVGVLQGVSCTKELEAIQGVLSVVANQEKVKQTRRKEYKLFGDTLSMETNVLDLLLKQMQYTVECVNDFKKDNDLNFLTGSSEKGDFKSSDEIAWGEVIENLRKAYDALESISGKKIIRQVKDLAERLGMLHEKINTYSFRKKIEKEPSFEKKKMMVDELYEPYLSQNKVRESYLANYDLSAKDFHWNVSFLDGHQFEGSIDLFVGGSPCQSFSMVGKQRGLEDTRGTLFYEYARLVSEIKPKVFIYENVRAVLSNDEGRTWETMQKVFDDLGYVWQAQVLNAKDYGIPQNRERLFVVGFRKDLVLKTPFSFPKPVELNCTMKDFLLDNVSGKYYLPKKGVDFVTMEKNLTKKYTQIDGEIQLCQKRNQQFNWHGDFVFVEENHDMEKTMQDLEKYFLSEKVRKYVLATGTKNFYSRPKTDLEVARPLLTSMHKMHRAGVDNYVTTEGRLRKLTPRECLRLMGFCDSFKIVVSDTAMYQQAGNSIVVDVLIAIVSQILKSYPEINGTEKE